MYLDIIATLFAYLKTIVFGESGRFEYHERRRMVLGRERGLFGLLTPRVSQTLSPSVVKVYSRD